MILINYNKRNNSLSIEDGEITNECGYIYVGSTNRMEYIEKQKYGL